MNEINALEVFSESRNSAPAELPKFKNELLNEKTAEIRNIQKSVYTTASDAYYKISVIMSEIKQSELYKEDGFKDLAEYGDKVFGFKRALSYSYSRAGDVYRNEKLPDALRALPPSKLDALSAMSEEDMISAVESGKITATSTQKELRELNNEYKDKKQGVSGKVIPVYIPIIRYNGKDFELYVNNGLTEDDIKKIVIKLFEEGSFDFLRDVNFSDIEWVDETLDAEISIFNANYTYQSATDKKVTVKRKVYVENVSDAGIAIVTYTPYVKRSENPVIQTADETIKRTEQAYIDGLIDATTFQLITGKIPDYLVK